MAAVDPGFPSNAPLEALFRRGTRLAVVVCYVTALVVALMLVRPAFRDAPASAVPARAPETPVTDEVRKGESVATFAARHGLGLGDLLALNPRIDSLSLRPGTRLRTR